MHKKLYPDQSVTFHIREHTGSLVFITICNTSFLLNWINTYFVVLWIQSYFYQHSLSHPWCKTSLPGVLDYLCLSFRIHQKHCFLRHIFPNTCTWNRSPSSMLHSHAPLLITNACTLFKMLTRLPHILISLWKGLRFLHYTSKEQTFGLCGRMRGWDDLRE